tara:strand:+ start:625 stop:876 length:252 start_codon:yes stop_codon:yes gene_type:complete
MNNKIEDKKQINDYKDFEEMVTAHRGVLKSLIDKDEYYKSGEAVEINNGFGKQLNVLKMKMEAFKLIKETPKRSELFLPEKKQ